MNLPATLFVSVLSLSAAAFAAEVDLSKLPPAANKPGVTYQTDIRPLFETSCFGCHSPQRPRPAGGLRLDTLELALKGGKDGKVIVPGESTKSSLVIAVSQLDPKSAMPPKRARVVTGGAVEANPTNPPHPPGTPPQPQGMGEGDQPPPGGMNPPPGAPPGSRPRGPQGPPPKPLTAEQVGLVRAWIDQGAR